MMSARLSNLQLMPYGVDRPSFDDARVERQTRGGLELAVPFPCVGLDLGARTALTLNNTRYDLEGMPDLSESGGSEALFIRDLIKRQCRPWEPQAQRLVDRYFALLDELLLAHEDELKAQLAPFAGLYDYRHWLFSAPRPFPRAHLFAPVEVSPAPKLDPDDFVAVDFAFFLGPEIVALLPTRSGLTPRKERERLERLQRAGVRVATYGPAEVADEAEAFFSKALASRLPEFWLADELPIGPFRPLGIED